MPETKKPRPPYVDPISGKAKPEDIRYVDPISGEAKSKEPEYVDPISGSLPGVQRKKGK